MAMDQHIQDMCLLASMRHLGGLAIVPFLALMLALPAVAQTNSDSETQGTDTAGVSAPSESERGPTSSNPVTQKTFLHLERDLAALGPFAVSVGRIVVVFAEAAHALLGPTIAMPCRLAGARLARRELIWVNVTEAAQCRPHATFLKIFIEIPKA
jgi:hypothetical protein